MFVSYRWLARHVDLEGITPEQLGNDLTLSTCEVEGIEAFAPHLSHVTVGHVLERAPHPDADKLGICKVDVGSGEPLQIVCGAPNVGPRQRVAVATVGTVLPGDFKIKKSKIRGVESLGMICSVRELDLGDEHDGIWVLPEPNGEPLAIGQSVADALGMGDWVIEIDNKSLTHRPDLWGHRGIAREVAAIYKRALKPLDLTLPALGGAPAFPVKVDDAACSRYIGLGIDGVQNGASPDWMRQLLLAVGQRPIDLFVDLSNFVMLDLGQPNHAFDRTALDGGGIAVRKAHAGETMTTLDGDERKLETSDLLITSGDAPVALAGIMGGEESKIQGGTSKLLLECAAFDATTVRRTSSRLALRTDSSARFEKSLDPTLPEKAAAHFARLLQEIQPGVSFPMVLADEGSWSDPATTIHVRGDVVRRDLGVDLSDEAIAAILARLELTPTAKDGGYEVAIPSARATKDLTMERDLVEEVGRIHRYGSVPEAALVGAVTPPPFDRRRAMVRAMEDRLAGSARFHQVLSYSFQSDDLLAKVNADGGDFVTAQNPVAPELSRIRREVLPSVLGHLESARRQRGEVMIFEVGKGYRPEEAGEDGMPREVHQVVIAIARAKAGAAVETFNSGAFFTLRAVVDDVIRAAGVALPCWSQGAGAPHATLHPVKQIAGEWSVDGQTAGVIGDLDPEVRGRLGLVGELDSDVAVAVLDVDALLAAPAAPRTYTPLPKFPSVKVDVACVAPEELPASELSKAIEAAGKGSVADIELFDVFKGESLGEGKKSLAYHVVLQSATKTLTDKDANKFLSRLERTLETAGAALRR
ncbi:MAG: phenylalanyl-tRNA synthetase beta chain [Planctomycetota bacterium]|jgi:phenylalanyl-tRNA synthetase beta chain